MTTLLSPLYTHTRSDHHQNHLHAASSSSSSSSTSSPYRLLRPNSPSRSKSGSRSSSVCSRATSIEDMDDITRISGIRPLWDQRQTIPPALGNFSNRQSDYGDDLGDDEDGKERDGVIHVNDSVENGQFRDSLSDDTTISEVDSASTSASQSQSQSLSRSTTTSQSDSDSVSAHRNPSSEKNLDFPLGKTQNPQNNRSGSSSMDLQLKSMVVNDDRGHDGEDEDHRKRFPEEEDEEILRESNSRFVLFPIRYREVRPILVSYRLSLYSPFYPQDNGNQISGLVNTHLAPKLGPFFWFL